SVALRRTLTAGPSVTAWLVRWGLDARAARAGRLLHVLQQHGLAHRAHELPAVGDHRLGHAGDAVGLRQLGVAGHFHAVGRDLVALERELEGQADRPGAIGSGGSGEDLDVHRPFEGAERLAHLVAEAAVAAGDVQDGVDQRPELVAGGTAVEPDTVV